MNYLNLLSLLSFNLAKSQGLQYGQESPSYGQESPVYGQESPVYGQKPQSYGQEPQGYGQGQADNYPSYQQNNDSNNNQYSKPEGRRRGGRRHRGRGGRGKGRKSSKPQYGQEQTPQYGQDQTSQNEDQNNTVVGNQVATELLQLVNKERAKVGAPPMKINDKLMKAAQSHSEYQAKTRKMGHQGAGGSRGQDRAKQFGYQGRGWAENVAFNQKTPKEVMNVWMNSPGHKRNILDRKLNEVGFGMKNYYWTQSFGSN